MERAGARVSTVTTCVAAAALWPCAATCSPTLAQQFNSDNYLSKPHGTATLIINTGQQATMFMTTLSLFPNWELTAAAYLYNRDADRKTGEGYSASLYAKYMIFENKAKTGGIPFKFGAGQEPSYVLDGMGFEGASQTYWVNSPLTLPFLDNRLSWDIMPGASVTRNFGDNDATLGAFTYGGQFNGQHGSGFEIGVMLFSPPFACIGPCRWRVRSPTAGRRRERNRNQGTADAVNPRQGNSPGPESPRRDG